MDLLVLLRLALPLYNTVETILSIIELLGTFELTVFQRKDVNNVKNERILLSNEKKEKKRKRKGNYFECKCIYI